MSDLESFPYNSIFWKNHRGLVYFMLLFYENIWFNLKASEPGAFFLWKVVNYQFNFININRFIQITYISLWILVVCTFHGIGPLHVSCQICRHRVTNSIQFFSFNVSGWLVMISSFISNVGNLCLQTKLFIGLLIKAIFDYVHFPFVLLFSI